MNILVNYRKHLGLLVLLGSSVGFTTHPLAEEMLESPDQDMVRIHQRVLEAAKDCSDPDSFCEQNIKKADAEPEQQATVADAMEDEQQ